MKSKKNNMETKTKSGYSFIANFLRWIWRSLTFRINEPAYMGEYIEFKFKDGSHFPSPKLWSFGRYNSVAFKFIIDEAYHNCSDGKQIDKVAGIRGWPKRAELILGVSPSDDPEYFRAFFYRRVGEDFVYDEIDSYKDLKYGKEYSCWISSRDGSYSMRFEEPNYDGLYDQITGKFTKFPYFSVLLQPYIGGKSASKGSCSMWVKWFKAVKI